MKTLVLIILTLLSTTVFAAGRDLGLGVMLGNPTGLNGKYWLGNNRAVDGGLAYSFGRHTDLSIHSDYLLHNDSAFYLNDTHPLDLYYGIGGRMEFADDIEIGVRIPVGLVHKMNDGEADIFGEIAPIVDLFTKTGLEIHFAIGARYYF
jgi:hypothetical protein